MLNKITAAALSTVLCVTSALQCSVSGAETKKMEFTSEITSAHLTKSAENSESVSQTEDTENAGTEAASYESEIIQEGTIGVSIVYELHDDGTLYISGSGAMKDYHTSPFAKNAAAIKKVIITNDQGDITNISARLFSDCSALEELTLPDSIKTIDKNAFSNCSLLSIINCGKKTSEKAGVLNLPENLSAINDHAFSGCSSLTNVQFGVNLNTIDSYAFADCEKLTEVIVPENVSKIGIFAFSGCTSLEKAVLNGCVNGIGEYAFDKCTALSELTLPYAGLTQDSSESSWIAQLFKTSVEGMTYSVQSSNSTVRNVPLSLKSVTITSGKVIPANTFMNMSSLNDISIPDETASVGNNAFKGCIDLKKLNLPDTVTIIGDHAFEGCKSINITIPSATREIGKYAFAGCESIDEITVPESALIIGDLSFSGCTSLKKAVIQGGANGIGESIFNKCTALEELTLPFVGLSAENAKSAQWVWIGLLFGNAVEEKTYAATCSDGTIKNVPLSLTSITITGGNKVPDQAFMNLSSLKKITLPNDTEIIGNKAFNNLSELTDFTMPEKLTLIGDYAFEGCKAINTELPSGIARIGKFAFAGCESIEEITVPESTVNIGASAFSGCTSLKKAVINGCSNSIGESIFNRCIKLEKITLPYAGLSSEAVNNTAAASWLGLLFGNAVEGKTYNASSSDGTIKNIPLALTGITITGGANIPAQAFMNLSSLMEVNLPDDAASIGNNAFSGCTGLKKFEIPSKAQVIGDRAFSSCKNIAPSIPTSITNIGKYAFAGCESIEEINVPDCTNTVGEFAFSGCISLRKAVINGGGNSIGEGIFNQCISLEEIVLPYAGFAPIPENEKISSTWLGYLFNAEVEGKTYRITNNVGLVKNIPLSLKNITISGGSIIPDNAFMNLAVANVTLPKDVKQIGNNVFEGCQDIINVFYPNTQAAWKENVTIGNKNEAVEGKVRYLSDEGKYIGVVTTSTVSTTTTITASAETTTTFTETATTSTATTTTSTETTTTAADYSLGDVNNDSKVNAVDATAILVEYALTQTSNPKGEFNEAQKKSADVNSDGKINAIDATVILSFYAYSATHKGNEISISEFLSM